MGLKNEIQKLNKEQVLKSLEVESKARNGKYCTENMKCLAKRGLGLGCPIKEIVKAAKVHESTINRWNRTKREIANESINKIRKVKVVADNPSLEEGSLNKEAICCNFEFRGIKISIKAMGGQT